MNPRLSGLTLFPACLLLPVLLFGQVATGELHIEVKDPSGAAMQVSGRLENLQTGAARSFRTDPSGKFTVSNLGLGRYRLELSRGGFATQSVDVDVESGTPVARTITMALGVANARVDVVAATPLAGADLT